MMELKQGRFGELPAKTACRECPFRTDSARCSLGGWTVGQYITAVYGPPDIGCHMSKGFEERDQERTRSCTGLAAFRRNLDVSMLPGNARNAALATPFNMEGIFTSADAFACHHNPEFSTRPRKLRFEALSVFKALGMKAWIELIEERKDV